MALPGEQFVRDTVSFQQINQILEITDQMGFNREWVEIPLSTGTPGKVHKLPNGKIEIIVDGEVPFDEWVASLGSQLKPFASS